MGDEQPIRGDAVARVLAVAGIAVPARANTFAETIEACCRQRPQLVLFSAAWPAPRAVIALRSAACGTRVVVHAVAEPIAEAAASLLAAGVHAVVPASATRRDLIDTVSLAAGPASAATGGLRGRPTLPRPVLSERELDVVRLAAQGCSVVEIGRGAYMSAGTVKTHLQNVYRKLGARNRAAAIAEANRRGLLDTA